MISFSDTLKKNLIYIKKDILYADNTGTSQGCPLIDKYMINHVYPYYANVHSNSLNSQKMTENIENTKKYIREVMNVLPTQNILFTGNGTTGAINHLINSLNFNKYYNVNIIISLYEHYSNHLPWIEKSKIYDNIKIYIIPLKDGIIDYEWYQTLYDSLDFNDLNITSITGCSNVSGVITDINRIKKIMNNRGLLFADLASYAPYKKIDASLYDACFISPHKFIGGIATPGILIANNELFMNECPYAPGGGCVKTADQNTIIYENDIEKRESGGTPNIIGIIRIKYILILKEKYFNIITFNEHYIVKYVHSKLLKLCGKLPNLKVLYLNKHLESRLPIICINIDNCHYNIIVKLMNDIFGIQTRGGISCCGLLASHIKKNMNIEGWCRITFHWIMSIEEIDYILNAIKYIAINHKKLY